MQCLLNCHKVFVWFCQLFIFIPPYGKRLQALQFQGYNVKGKISDKGLSGLIDGSLFNSSAVIKQWVLQSQSM